MTEIEKLIEEKIKHSETVPDKFLSSIDRENERLWKEMLNEIKVLEVEDGKFVVTAENINAINAILDKIKRSLFGGDYLNALKEFVKQIQTQADLTNQILERNADFNDSDVYKALVEKSQHNTLLLFDENAIASNFLQPINDLMTNAIVNSVGYLDAVESLRNSMTGDNAVFAKYAKTYAKDAFAVSDRQYTQLVSKDFGIIFYKFDGSRVRGSRYFCCQRKGGYFHMDEIRSWGDDEGLWDKPSDASGPCSTANGGGRNADTNSATIFSYLGGYGCIDVLIPFGTRYVPQEWIQRAIDLGYYSPD